MLTIHANTKMMQQLFLLFKRVICVDMVFITSEIHSVEGNDDDQSGL